MTPAPTASRIGLVVEGETEYRALPLLLQHLGLSTTSPSIFHGQSVNASVQDLVKYRLLTHARTQLAKKASQVIVVLDRETRPESADVFGKALAKELRRQLRGCESEHAARRVFVAVADRRFENWLLADPEGVSKSKLLGKKANLVGRVACHADDRDALEVLREAIARGWYNKAIHGPQLAQHIRMRPVGISWCSKSFAAFLGLVTARDKPLL
jgi:hypothetical protein